MPVDSPETIQAGGLEHLDTRRVSVSKNAVVEYAADPEFENIPEPGELHGPNALRRVAAPIPWSVYTVAFVELCERFSYYGTQIVCEYCNFRSILCPTNFPRFKLRESLASACCS